MRRLTNELWQPVRADHVAMAAVVISWLTLSSDLIRRNWTHWTLIKIACVCVSMLAYHVAFRRRERLEEIAERRANGLCLECGYDLRDIDGPCPECGGER